MTTKVFYSHLNKNKETITKYFEENNIDYTMQEITGNPISWDQFLSIIDKTEDGIESILPVKPTKDAKAVLDTIDFDSIKLKEFYHLAAENPCIIRTPIVVKNNAIMIGYNKDEMCLFDNKKDKKARFSKLLESARMMERYDLEDKLGYSLG